MGQLFRDLIASSTMQHFTKTVSCTPILVCKFGRHGCTIWGIAFSDIYFWRLLAPYCLLLFRTPFSLSFENNLMWKRGYVRYGNDETWDAYESVHRNKTWSLEKLLYIYEGSRSQETIDYKHQFSIFNERKCYSVIIFHRYINLSVDSNSTWIISWRLSLINTAEMFRYLAEGDNSAGFLSGAWWYPGHTILAVTSTATWHKRTLFSGTCWRKIATYGRSWCTA